MLTQHLHHQDCFDDSTHESSWMLFVSVLAVCVRACMHACVRAYACVRACTLFCFSVHCGDQLLLSLVPIR